MSADIAFGQDARDVQIPAVSGCTRIARDGKNMCLQDSARVLERMAGMAVQICTPETTRMFVIFLALAVLQTIQRDDYLLGKHGPVFIHKTRMNKLCENCGGQGIFKYCSNLGLNPNVG